MGGRGFSATKLVLIVVLLGAVFMVSKVVTPAPPGPPAEPVQTASAPAGTPAKPMDKTKQMEMMKQQREHYEEMRKMHEPKPGQPQPPKLDPLADPNSMDIKPDYFYHTKSGDAGLQQVQTRVSEGQAQFDKYKQEMDEYKKQHPTPPASASSTPPAK